MSKVVEISSERGKNWKKLDSINWDFKGTETQYLTHKYHSYPEMIWQELSFLAIFLGLFGFLHSFFFFVCAASTLFYFLLIAIEGIRLAKSVREFFIYLDIFLIRSAAWTAGLAAGISKKFAELFNI